MRYRVTAQERGNWPGRWRSGRFFPSGQWTELDEAEVTDAMRADPVLIIVAVDEPAEKPAAKGGRK